MSILLAVCILWIELAIVRPEFVLHDFNQFSAIHKIVIELLPPQWTSCHPSPSHTSSWVHDKQRGSKHLPEEKTCIGDTRRGWRASRGRRCSTKQRHSLWKIAWEEGNSGKLTNSRKKENGQQSQTQVSIANYIEGRRKTNTDKISLSISLYSLIERQYRLGNTTMSATDIAPSQFSSYLYAIITHVNRYGE